MTISVLDAPAIRRALSIRDLTDPAQGRHAMQVLSRAVVESLTTRMGVPVVRVREHPVVSVQENYDRLRVPAGAVARDARYTRYLNERTVLRTMASAMVPPALERLAGGGEPEALLACEGIVYRRDTIDRLHTGEPHQLDLWRIRSRGGLLAQSDLDEMIAAVVAAALPGRRWRTVAAEHPYTTGGLQIDVRDGEEWVEIGECGLAHPEILAAAGLPAGASGLAMGVGLDRLLMLRKGVPDIRLLRSADPRVAGQMLDLEPYRPVSAMPPVRRDISIAVTAGVSDEDLGDRVRAALGPDAAAVEEIAIVSETPCSRLPAVAVARLGATREQCNLLVRVVLRDLERTLTDAEANGLRDRIYLAIHEGRPVLLSSEHQAKG